VLFVDSFNPRPEAIPASKGIDLQQDIRISAASPRHDMQGSHENARPDLKARTDGPRRRCADPA
jgi:hypothetical protein